MNGYESDEGFESVAELLEDIESDESDESDEAAESKRFGRRLKAIRPKVPSGKGLFRARPTSQNVTQVQLQAALARVGAQIKTNADATSAVGARVNTVNTRVDAEIAARKKETSAIRKDLSSGKMMSILPMLLAKPPSLKTLTVSNGVVTSQTYEKQDNLLPLIMLMGTGSGGDGKGDDSNMMLMAMVLMNK